jgi:hypothetical protein
VYTKTDDHEAYAKLDEELNAFYTANEASLRTYARRVCYNFVFDQAICVCKSKSNSRFYRAMVKFFKQSEQCLGENNRMDDERDAAPVFVTYIDYGILDPTSFSFLLPIVDEFCQQPPYSIPCRLDLVQPINDTVQGDWTDEAIYFFEHMLGKAHSSDDKSREITAIVFDNREPFQFVQVGFGGSFLRITILADFNQVCDIYIIEYKMLVVV